MRVRQAKDIASKWVREEGIKIPGFFGAFHNGSTLWGRDDDQLEASSDVDLMVVLDSSEKPERIGKFRYQGVLLEVGFVSREKLASAESVLADYHLAGSFHLPSVISDPSSQLTSLQAVVIRDFAERRWVLARCEDAMGGVPGFLGSLNEAAPLVDQVGVWAFGTGVMTHVLLVAGLRNPTIRRRYAAVQQLLAERNLLDYHETLLDLLGCAEMAPEHVEQHLAALERAFDAAKMVRAPGFRFSSDITDEARAISIDGSRQLIRAGLHREAVFWLLATYTRCITKLSIADVDPSRHETDLRRLLKDLGADSFADRRAHADRVLATLPEHWEVALSLAPSKS